MTSITSVCGPAFPKHEARRLIFSAACGTAILCASAVPAAEPVSSPALQPISGPAILQELREFQELGTVLFIAAHPDDENTQLITYLARGRHYRTAYLSVTRGDGGQNVLGSDLDEKLGVARTQELLAARRLDGGRQFFTRAIDFGFSKDYRETLNVWNRQEVISDYVRIIRTFRPDVLITRFSPQPGGTHGHHTASAVLALEAFKLAGDSAAFPEQLKDLKPWQPRRIFMNRGGGRGGGGGNNQDGLRIDVSGNDPVLGVSFNELANRSRAMHKTQGFGNFGGFGGGGARSESFQLLDGEPATNDIMDGIDTTWNRISGGEAVGKLASELMVTFKTNDPAASVSLLLKTRKQLASLPEDPLVIEKRALLNQILQHCLGIEVATLIPQPEVVPGEDLKLHHTALIRSSVPVRWVSTRYPSIRQEAGIGAILKQNQASSKDSTQSLPADTPLTQPYWLRQERTAGMFQVDDSKLIGQPENPPVFPVEHIFEVNGEKLTVPDQPMHVSAEKKDEIPRGLDVIPPVSLGFGSEVALFTPGSSRTVEVVTVAARANVAGTLRLNSPSGWKVSPEKQPFRLAKPGESARFKFTITAPAQPANAKMIASAEVSGVSYQSQRVEVNYRHLPLQLLQPPAAIKVVSLDLAIRGKSVGYLPGAGDSVAEVLEQMGYQVKTLDGELTAEQLKGLDAVVVGVRAFNVRSNMSAQTTPLFAYAEGGGTVILQYNRPDQRGTQMTPFTLRVSGERVTDENAEMTFLAPDHPALNTPNKITQDDFKGWVQERGIYFANQWGEQFTPILACHDAGESPLKGALLVAPHGKGYFVYTGLAFFRQLPAGVPGAYRLFGNLVSLGK
jgi:LmbE family N-acetylglucosaminyl deacetylase